MINRRQLLSVIPQLAVLSSISGLLWARSSAENILVGGGQYIDRGKTNFVISTVRYDSLSLNLAPIDFLAHGFHRQPNKLEHLAVFEKKGPGALLFDIKNNEVLERINPVPGRAFYGHGAYSHDSRLLYSTETDLASREGYIGVRDAQSLSYLGDFPSYGQEPHECKLLNQGRILVVTNGGGGLDGRKPCVCYIDVQSQKLIERVELSNSRLNTGHLAIGPKGQLVVVSAPRAGLGKTHVGGVSMRSNGGALQSMSEPLDIAQRLFGEALSVVIQPQAGIIAVSHPAADMLSFWSLAEQKLLTTIELETPRGLSLSADRSQFIVSYGARANLARIDLNSLKLIPASVLPASYLTGSHIYNWSLAMSELSYPGPLI